MNLPNQGNIVLCDILVGTDEGHLFGNGGCDKQTVESLKSSRGASKSSAIRYFPFAQPNTGTFFCSVSGTKVRIIRPVGTSGGTSIVSLWLAGTSTVCVTLIRKI